MKKLTLIIITILLTSAIWCGIFDSEFEKNIKYLSREELEDIAIQQQKDFEKIKTDYNKLYKNYIKYFEAYKSVTKRPVLLANIHFSMSAGVSAIVNYDNPLKSNIDLNVNGSFYFKYMKYSIGYMPANKIFYLSVGVFY